MNNSEGLGDIAFTQPINGVGSAKAQYSAPDAP